MVKFYRPLRWSYAQIDEEHAFVAELAAHEVPVVAPLSLEGRTLHVFAGHRFAVYPQRGGRHPELDRVGVLEWLGRFIGRIHAVGRQRAFAQRPVLDIWMADTKVNAEKAFDRFVTNYGAKYPKATECLAKDRTALLAFYDFPAAHWIHIRSSNVIESSFATIRHRTDRTKGCLTRDGICSAHCSNLRMCGWVGVADRLVESRRQDFVVFHHHRADRHFRQCPGVVCLSIASRMKVSSVLASPTTLSLPSAPSVTSI